MVFYLLKKTFLPSWHNLYKFKIFALGFEWDCEGTRILPNGGSYIKKLLFKSSQDDELGRP